MMVAMRELAYRLAAGLPCSRRFRGELA